MKSRSLPLPFFALCLLLPGPLSRAGEAIGVSEPAHLVNLSFPESGIIGQIAVKEGEDVAPGQLLASLDNRVLEAQHRIALIRSDSSAQIKSSKALMDMRLRRLQKLVQLSAQGSAHDDELAKARSEYTTAEAEASLASEKSEEHKLEAAQIEAQIAQRTLRSPIPGVVTRIYREVAENVSQSDAVVLTVAQLDTLEIVMHIDPPSAAKLRVGQKLLIQALRGEASDEAEVVFVSPVTESSSGTNRVRLVVDNKDGRHRSGVKYRVQLEDGVASTEPR